MDKKNQILPYKSHKMKSGESQQTLSSGGKAAVYLDRKGIIKFFTPLSTKITGIKDNDIGSFIGDVELVHNNPQLAKKINELIDFLKNNSQDFINQSDEHQQDSLNEILAKLINQQDFFEFGDSDKNIYQLILHPHLSDKMEVIGIILVFYDISKRKQTEITIETEREKYRILAELTDCALWEYDRDTGELRHYHKLKGRHSDQLKNIPNYRETMLKYGWVHPEDIEIFNEYCDSMDRGDEYLQYELRILGDNDDFMWMRFQGSALKDKNREIHLIMGRTINIDKERREHEKLLMKMELDSLTGLYNRSAVKEKIDKCFERSNPDCDVHNFMIIDIDDFKKANDRYGHIFGDTLLESFAAILSKLFDNNDVTGRLGGDEFIVLQKGTRDKFKIMETAQSVCDLAKKILSVIKEETTISVSVGIALYPDDGTNYETLYSKADTALYEAKARGKDQYVFYEPEMEAMQQVAVKERSMHRYSRIYDSEDAPIIEKRLLNFAFDIVSEAKDLDYAIQSIFQEIGKFYGLTRITLLELGNMGNKVSISNQWADSEANCADVTLTRLLEPVKDQLKQLYTEKSIFYFNDIHSADISSDLRHVYQTMGAKSAVQCAVYDSNVLVGVINYVDCASVRQWTKLELDTLNTLTKLVTSFILQIRNKQELDNEIFFTQAMLNNQKLSNYAIREGTYELLYFSEYTENLFPNVKLGELCYKTIFGRETPCEACPLKGLDDNNKRYSVEAYNEANESWYTTTASTVEMPNGKRMNLICASDVTGFMERVNSRDPLTGLLTFSKFEAEAMKLIAGSGSNRYAILYSDFDKFKNINDEWSYSIGNEILIYFAKKVSEFIQPSELFCRVTADKFILLLQYEDKDKFMGRINHSYETISADFRECFPKVNPVFISGVYFLEPGDKVLSVAMDKANLARKSIKGGHKSNIAIYDASFHEQVTKEKMIENHMYEALKNNEFVVYMQPKIDLYSLKIIGAEALVRWHLPSGELMGPMEFIPVFERNGFIDELDFYVYEKTFQALHDWLEMGKQPIILSINVSRIHLNDSHFLEKLDKLVEKYELPTRLIELELTESMFFKELDRLNHIVSSLRERGFLISIDDFGSGYSSLNLLKTLPIDILKLDREFFMRNEMGENDKIIISGIISLAKGLGLKVISEGVETIEQVRFLRESSCDMVQGFVFYKPLPMEDFADLLD